MASMVVAGPVTMSRETGTGRRPASPRLAPAEAPAPALHARLRPLEVAQCSLCGIAVPLGLLVPDGGQACADIRWYCKDAQSCTGRWTTARPPRHLPAAPGAAIPAVAEPAPDPAPAEQSDGLPEQGQPAG